MFEQLLLLVAIATALVFVFYYSLALVGLSGRDLPTGLRRVLGPPQPRERRQPRWVIWLVTPFAVLLALLMMAAGVFVVVILAIGDPNVVGSELHVSLRLIAAAALLAMAAWTAYLIYGIFTTRGPSN